ncbi:MAG: hypothetical protein JWR22_3339 [Herminiimonas sp.]|nr:hypothetical protein [Herminiimonas sp.]
MLAQRSSKTGKTQDAAFRYRQLLFFKSLRSRPQLLLKRLRFSVSISSILALAVGLSLTALLFAAARRIEFDQHSSDFKQMAQLRLVAVNEGVDDVMAALHSVERVFVSIGDVRREQFRSFVQPLLARYPYIQAFNFHRLVEANERSAYEASMQKAFPGFGITELRNGKMVKAGIRPLYDVVHYLEPLQGNEKAFGFDAFSYSYQIGAIQRMRETGLPSATGLVRLVLGQDEHPGVIIVMPVYRATREATDPLRGRVLIGDVAAVFRAGEMMEKILASRGVLAQSGVGVTIYAGDTPAALTKVFQWGPSGGKASKLLSPAWLWYDHADSISGRIDMPGSPWHMVISAQPTLFMLNHSGSLYVLIGGILFSFLSAAYVYTLVSRNLRIERAVGERTSALQFANQRLTEDIAGRVHSEKALRLRERVIEVSANAIIIANSAPPDYLIEYVNPAFERITGYAAADVIGRSLKNLQGDDRDQQNIEPIRAALRERREGHATLRIYRKDGSLYWTDLHVVPVLDDSAEISHFVVAQYDISEAKRYEGELEFQASHDTLTGLANRGLLRDRLGLAIAYSTRYGTPVWVLYVDLDRFKFVNDTLGQLAGDKMLQVMAERMLAAAGEVDTVARLSGDEFVLVLAGGVDEVALTAVIQKVIAAISHPVTIEGHEFVQTCSVGVAVCPMDGRDPDTLLKHANIARYRAKELGGNRFQFYTPSMNERTLERLRIEGDLRSALARDEFVLHYQPQVNLKSGRITGMEALIRWNHPQLGLLGPGRFIGLAEETGLIVSIGAWVLRTACAQNMAWHRAGYADLRVAVNLSARQFTQEDLVASVATMLNQTGLGPEYLEIELTESLVMTDVDHAIGVLHDFVKLGVTLSVDDFGTGYSSLSYLIRLPLNVLKIDQSFVRDITTNPDSAAIAASIISLAHSLRLHVIAEGVETVDQLTFLRNHGCNAMQGYYFSQAVPADLFTHMLQEAKCLPSASGEGAQG